MLKFSYLAWRDLLHYRLRTLLAVLGIAVVVMVFFILAGTAEGLSTVFNSTGSERNLMLVDSTAIVPDEAMIPADVVSQVEAVEGVQTVVPMLYRHMRVEGSILHVRANPLETYQEAHQASLVDGVWLKEEDDLMLGEGLAKLEGWQVGQKLQVAGETFTVSGIFQAEGAKNSEIWISLPAGVDLMGRSDSYSMILILAEPNTDVETIYPRLKNVREGIDVVFENEYYEQSNQSMLQVRSVVLLVSAVALLAIAFGVFNVASMTVAEKRYEIGLLKAAGVSKQQILGVFLVEGLLLAVIGFLLGLGGGAAILLWLSANSVVSLADNTIQPHLTPEIVLLGGILTFSLSIIGVYFPARSASVTSIIDAMRGV